MNESLPPTVFLFSGWLGTIFLAIVLTLTPTPRKQGRKRRQGEYLKPNSPSLHLLSSSLSCNLSLQNRRSGRVLPLNTPQAEILEAAGTGADHTTLLGTEPPRCRHQTCSASYLGPRPNNAARSPLRTHLISLFLCGPFNC